MNADKHNRSYLRSSAFICGRNRFSFMFKGFAVLVLASSLFAGETRTWSQNGYSDFEKGVIKNLSVRSDGLLTLAPHSHEFFDATSSYLWALAQDSKGNLYA